MLLSLKNLIRLHSEPACIVDKGSLLIIDANQRFIKQYPNLMDSKNLGKFQSETDETTWNRLEFDSLILFMKEIVPITPSNREDLKSGFDVLKKENATLRNINMVQRIQLENYDFVTRVIGTINDFLFVVSPEGILLHVNEPVEKILGLKTGDALGASFYDFVVEASFIQDLLELHDTIEAKELTIITPDGHLPVLASSSPLESASGKVSGFVFMAKDITQLKEIHDQLHQAKIHAEKANLAKSQFLSNMSHELRTPLNAIIGYSELLIEEAEDDCFDFVLEQLPRIKDSGCYLLELINNILDIAKIEAGRSEILLSMFDLGSFTTEVQTIVNPLAETNQNSLIIDVPKDITHIESDPRRIKQILVNLLSNALKFTKNGEVRLVVTQEDHNHLVFTVSDTGKGISEEELPKIFDKFVQVHDLREETLSGSGLGLSIVKSLVELLKGNISVSSQIDVGTVFTVDLPINVIQHQEPTSDKSNILIVDDDGDIREYISMLLDPDRFNALEAASAAEAIEMMANREITAILSDIHMPNESGLDLLEKVRKKHPHLPFGFITGTTIKEVEAKCSAQGIPVLSKPFTENELRQLIEQLLEEPSATNSIAV